jgi:hypothetical protein
MRILEIIVFFLWSVSAFILYVLLMVLFLPFMFVAWFVNLVAGWKRYAK